MLYVTARQVNWEQQPAEVSSLTNQYTVRLWRFTLPVVHLIRLGLVIIVLLLVLALANRPDLQLPFVPDYVNLAIYGLAVMGLLGMVISRDPLKAGMAFLLFMNGFELLYNVLEQTPAVIIVLAGANLAFTLVIAYLTQMRYASPISLDET